MSVQNSEEFLMYPEFAGLFIKRKITKLKCLKHFTNTKKRL